MVTDTLSDLFFGIFGATVLVAIRIVRYGVEKGATMSDENNLTKSVGAIAGRVFGELRRGSMIGIKCLRFTLGKRRVAEPDR